MNYIYLDNASTTFPKAPNVANAMANYITNYGININRGSYALAYDVEDIIYTTRQRLNTLINGHDPSHVIFTQNVTMSLNMVIKGLLKAGDHVLVSSMEHNAVMRPLTQLVDQGITFDIIPVSYTHLDVYKRQAHTSIYTALKIVCHIANTPLLFYI